MDHAGLPARWLNDPELAGLTYVRCIGQSQDLLFGKAQNLSGKTWMDALEVSGSTGLPSATNCPSMAGGEGNFIITYDRVLFFKSEHPLIPGSSGKATIMCK